MTDNKNQIDSGSKDKEMKDTTAVVVEEVKVPVNDKFFGKYIKQMLFMLIYNFSFYRAQEEPRTLRKSI